VSLAAAPPAGDSGVAFLGLICVVFSLFFAVALPLVTLLNRALGKAFDDKARAIAPILAGEGLLFVEDDVKTRGTWIAPLAVGVRPMNADVRVTTRAIYLMQHRRMFGSRMGQPILAFPLRGAILDPRVVMNVRVGVLETYPREEGGGVILRGTLGVQRFTLRVAVRDVAGFLRCS